MLKTKKYSEDLKNVVINVTKKGKSQTLVAKNFGLSKQIKHMKLEAAVNRDYS